MGDASAFTGNRIYDAPHTAIFYVGNEMLIEANEIFDVLKETGDAGAVYSGRDPTSRGNVLRFNYIHDCGVQNETAVTMAFYLDDCDCGDSYISNRVVNVPWRSRYPDLVDYLKNDPRTPKNISVHGNMFSDCKRNIIFENMPKGLDRTLDIQR